MNFFFQHIEYLLLRHDCVVVPGLGAFIATSTPARIDMKNGEIVPPSRAFMFNQAVSLDDGLLANSIARKAGISFEDARNAIVRCVAKIKEILDNKKIIQIGSIGSLTIGEEGNLLFAPNKTALSSEELGYLKINVKTDINKSQTESSQVENSEKRYYQLRISKTFARVAAMIAVMAVVVLTVILNPLPTDNREQRASVVPVEKILSTPTCPEMKIDTVAAVDEIQETVEEVKLPAHYLIVATFSNAAEAERYAEKYSTDEYPLTAVASRKLTRVSIAASDDWEELRKKLNSSAISNRYPNAWIWSRN